MATKQCMICETILTPGMWSMYVPEDWTKEADKTTRPFLCWRCYRKSLVRGAQDAFDDLPLHHKCDEDIERLGKENDRLRDIQDDIIKRDYKLEQILAIALGTFPWYKDDPKNFPEATEASGVCTGEHVLDTIVDDAATAINRFKTRELLVAEIRTSNKNLLSQTSLLSLAKLNVYELVKLTVDAEGVRALFTLLEKLDQLDT